MYRRSGQVLGGPRLFGNQQELDPAKLPSHARALGLDVAKFQQCLDTGQFTAKVKADLEEGTRVGIRGTPTFFFGYLDPKDPNRVKAVQGFAGAQPLAQFKQVIDRLLNAPKPDAAN